MKGNQIDDLFRKGLSHQKLAPPPAAWGAIEGNLPGKKKKGVYFWMRIAAGILLICTIGWLTLTQPGTQSGIDTNIQAEVKATPAIKTPTETVAPVEKLVAESKESPATKNTQIPQAPAIKSLVAKSTNEANVSTSELTEPAEVTMIAIPTRMIAKVDMIIIDKNSVLAPQMTASEFRYDMLMPLELSAYYIPYTEDLQLAPRKKRFRVLNGIISIAKEVNTGKLSFSELRNAKNSFVEEDLKYGSKESEGDSSDEPPKSPEKD